MVSQTTADVARRAQQLYDEKLCAPLEVSHLHDYLAIEPDSGEYFFGKTLTEAIQASRVAHPIRLAFAMQIGRTAAVHLGALSP